MVTLTISVPSCRTLRTCNSLLLRCILVCAVLWLFISAKEAIRRRRREVCSVTSHRSRVREVEPRHRDNVARPSYSEDRKQVVHVPDRLVVDQVQQTEEEKRKRFATTPDDITDVTSQADRSQRPSKTHLEQMKQTKESQQQQRQQTKHGRTDELHDSGTERTEERSFRRLDDNVAWDKARQGDSNQDNDASTFQKVIPSPKHVRVNTYRRTESRGDGRDEPEQEAIGTLIADSSHKQEIERRHIGDDRTSHTNRATRLINKDERRASKSKAEDDNERFSDGPEQAIINSELSLRRGEHRVDDKGDFLRIEVSRNDSDEDFSRGEHDIGDALRDYDKHQDDVETLTSTTSNEALFIISNVSQENDTIYYHRNLPPVFELHDKQEEKHLLPDPTVRICSQRQRQLHLRQTCHELLDEDRERRRYTKRRVKLVAISHQRKLLYCILSKTGSRSWLTFLANLSSDAGSDHNLRIRDERFMNKTGIEYRRNLYLDELDSRYRDYTRFVVVRHPLQRFASAYYESVVKNGKFRRNDGTLPSFREFSAMIAGGQLQPHVQMARYINHCQVCRTKYDYIVKAETIRSDFHLIRSDLATNVPLPREHVNKIYRGRHHTDVFKYDALLKTLQPENSNVLRGLAAVYEADNKIFGYGWDFDNQRSTCSVMQGDKPYPCC